MERNLRVRSQCWRRSQLGISLVEFAIVASLLVILLVAATDYSLAILARQEVHGAARAGVEFGINRGYNTDGIKQAALASGGSGGFRYASIASSGVTVPPVICACFGDIAGSSAAPAVTSTTPNSCPTDAVCTDPGGSTSKLSRIPYVKVTVSGSYTPIFGKYWFNLTNGQLNLSATYVGKTFFVN